MDLYDPKIEYRLIYPQNNEIWGRGDLPNICGRASSVNGSCHLKEGRNLIYSAPLNVYLSEKWWSFMGLDHLNLLLQIDMHGTENKFGRVYQIFRFEIIIELIPCLFHKLCSVLYFLS